MTATTIEATLVAKLLATAGVTALVGTTGVYPGVIKQGVATAAVSLQLIARDREQAFGKDTGLIRSRFQISCYGPSGASDFAAAKALAAAVVTVLSPSGGSRYRDLSGTYGVVIQDCMPAGEFETFDQRVESFGVLLDYDIWHN